MIAFLPTQPAGVAVVVVTAALLLILGARAASRPISPVATGLAWGLGLTLILVVERATSTEPAGWRMLAIIAVTFAAMKGVVAARSNVRLGTGAWWAFAIGWVGMNPGPFATPSRARSDRRVAVGTSITQGLLALAIGALLFSAARGLAHRDDESLPALLLAFPALSLLVHFGVFGILAGTWQRHGIRVSRAFMAPHRAVSLREFWSRRWNLPFSEMTSAAVYRPLARRWGRTPAVAAAFLFSGLLHELAISVPVKAGYGLPTTYFALHALAVLAEGAIARRGIELRGLRGRIWCALWLLVPLPLLFHRGFRDAIVRPLLAVGVFDSF